LTVTPKIIYYHKRSTELHINYISPRTLANTGQGTGGVQQSKYTRDTQ